MRKSMVKRLAGIGIWTVLVLGWSVNAYGTGMDGPEGIEEYQVESRLENDRQVLSAVHQCIRQGETTGEFVVTGRNYTPEGSILKTFYGDSLEYSSSLEHAWEQGENRWERIRFSVAWDETAGDEPAGEETDGGKDNADPDKLYWRLGDSVVRRIEGEDYVFRCIDQNYQNAGTAGQQGALFLCESVIPADTGAYYAYEKQEDGSYDYVYYPGPVTDFGDTDSYKYSRIRRWLDSVEQEEWAVMQVQLGVEYSYTGQTREGGFAQLDPGMLYPQPLGYQQMTGGLFLLSVEEALRYREYLWRFGVGPDQEENPDTQIGSFCKGYWLRSPCGDDGQPEAVYIVDLANGTIRPQPVTGFVGGLGIIGVRPVFVLPQKS